MRIVIVDNDVLSGEGLALMATNASHDVLAVATEADDFVVAADVHGPNMVVAVIQKAGEWTRRVISAVVELRRKRPDLGVLILSAYAEQMVAAELFTCGGPSLGYMLRDRVRHSKEFLVALQRVADGGVSIDPEVLTQLVEREHFPDGLERLSMRERDVLALMAEGLGNDAIAERLVVAGATVHKHIRNIYAKLGIASNGPMDRRVSAALRYLDKVPGGCMR